MMRLMGLALVGFFLLSLFGMVSCSSASPEGVESRCRITSCLSSKCDVSVGQTASCAEGGYALLAWDNGQGGENSCASNYRCPKGTQCYALHPDVNGYFFGVCE